MQITGFWCRQRPQTFLVTRIAPLFWRPVAAMNNDCSLWPAPGLWGERSDAMTDVDRPAGTALGEQQTSDNSGSHAEESTSQLWPYPPPLPGGRNSGWGGLHPGQDSAQDPTDAERIASEPLLSSTEGGLRDPEAQEDARARFRSTQLEAERCRRDRFDNWQTLNPFKCNVRSASCQRCARLNLTGVFACGVVDNGFPIPERRIRLLAFESHGSMRPMWLWNRLESTPKRSGCLLELGYSHAQSHALVQHWSRFLLV